MDSQALGKWHRQPGPVNKIPVICRVGAFILLMLFPLFGWTQALTLSTSTALATAGYYQLNWGETKTPANFQLQESRDEAFMDARVIYEGPNTASVISGRGNGEYLYRVRKIDEQSTSPWSQPVQVTVAHHSLNKAFTFFFIGLIVFIGTLIAIFRGSRQLSR